MVKDNSELFKKVPAVDRLLAVPDIREMLETFPRSMVLKAVRNTLEELRERIRKGLVTNVSEMETGIVSEMVRKRLEEISSPSLKKVVNATGVIVHTNLGRSPLASKVLERLCSMPGGYCNLEYDIERGKRGSRYSHVEGILKDLTGAEAAMVVNNNAAAVLLCLDTIARGRKVVISRGQLVEIGGSFRIPDVMRKSGALMVEVGTTNKTHLRDYETAIDSDTALLLKVHKSNFELVGFSEDVPLSDMVALGRTYGIPVMEDLGSGCFIDFSNYGFPREPTVQDELGQGADIVTFSGDKLLGGPQAGIILGRKEIVDRIKENQLTRALRIDKLTLLGLEETLRIYMDPERAVREIPTLRMMLQPYDDIKKKADRLFRMLEDICTPKFSVELCDGNSMTGGGALPLLKIRTRMISLVPGSFSAQRMEEWLRAYDPPVITRLKSERVLLDLRTIQEKDFPTVSNAIHEMALEGSN